MKNEKEQLEALQDIRKLMKDSSKFLSLSGLSGVFAGVYALIGAYLGHKLISAYIAGLETYYDHSTYFSLLYKIIFVCAGVLLLSVSTALYMSSRKAKKTNQSLFDHTSKKVFWCMAIPLFAGGVFCLAMMLNGSVGMISPVMLLFYGMALLNSSKYTMADIKYLSYLQITLGLVAAFFPGHGLLSWAIGFGGLHIVYGTIVWFKYDRVN